MMRELPTLHLDSMHVSRAKPELRRLRTAVSSDRYPMQVWSLMGPGDSVSLVLGDGMTGLAFRLRRQGDSLLGRSFFFGDNDAHGEQALGRVSLVSVPCNQ